MMQMQLDFPMHTQEPPTRAAKPLPPMVSKDALCRHFDISSKTLRAEILTDNILLAAGCTWQATDENTGLRAIQHKQRLPPDLTQLIYLTYNITELLRQKGK